MCLATPGVILAIHDGHPVAGATAPAEAPADPLWRSAEVDFGGVRQQVSLACLPEAAVGDRVLVHVGVALSLVHDDEPPWPAVPFSQHGSARSPSASHSDDGHPPHARR
jgi:hydrogenase expression/formation protein HypC